MFYIYSYDFGIIRFEFCPETVVQRYSYKAAFNNFAKFTRKHLCWSLFLGAASNFIEIETPVQVFSCEFLGKF